MSTHPLRRRAGIAGAVLTITLLGGCDLKPASEPAIPAVEAVPIDVAPQGAPMHGDATPDKTRTPDRNTPEKRQPENGTAVSLTAGGATR